MVPGLNHDGKPVRVKLPTFALLVLSRRAIERNQTIAEVLETALWNAVMVFLQSIFQLRD